MKILFLTVGENLDYQRDSLFHGLCSLPDNEVFILNEGDYDFMFTDLVPLEQRLKLYGMGYSISNRVPAEKKKVHSREEAKKNIAEKFYDLIVYGSILRCTELLDDVLAVYPRHQVIFVDGEDPDYAFRLRRGSCGVRYFRMLARCKHLSRNGVYFKRELHASLRKYFYPISFAIPEENIVAEIPEKTRDLAFLKPGCRETYIYHTEQDYNQAYQESRFGMTFKKGGWDCMRHYEILANGCIPYFTDIDDLPPDTMIFFPRELIKLTNRMYETNTFGDSYDYYCGLLLEHTRTFLTTRFLANYVLSTAAALAPEQE